MTSAWWEWTFDGSCASSCADLALSRRTLLIAASLFALYVIWGSTYFGIRVAIEAYSPLQVAAVRFLLAGSGLYAVLRWRGHRSPTFEEWRNAFFIGTLLLCCGNGFVSVAQKTVASSMAAIMIASMPLWAALFSGLWGKWPAGRDWLGLLLGAAGVVLLNLQTELRASPLGAVLLVLSPALWALGSVWSQHLKMPQGMMAPAAQMLGGSVSVVVLSLLMGEPWPLVPNARSLWALAYLIGFGSIVAYSAYAFLLRTVRPALATSYAYVNPPVAVIIGVVLGGEHVSGTELVGMAIVLVAVVLLTLLREKRRPLDEPVAVSQPR
jgi:drug/metabolite transporter (DMT)-like permease